MSDSSSSSAHRLPDYLRNTYSWAYLDHRTMPWLDRPVVVSAILWGNASRLMDAAVRDVKGKVEDKAALKKALEAKNFKSVRGDFRFNSNHYPVQNYYLRVVGKDAGGRITNRMMGTIFTNHADAYVSACRMK